MTGAGNEYFLLNNVLRKILVAPEYSDMSTADVVSTWCMVANLWIATAAWWTGIDIRCNTDATIAASRKVQFSWQSGNSIPLKNDCGLYIDFFNDM